MKDLRDPKRQNVRFTNPRTASFGLADYSVELDNARHRGASLSQLLAVLLLVCTSVTAETNKS
jgi:hypothetical protein